MEARIEQLEDPHILRHADLQEELRKMEETTDAQAAMVGSEAASLRQVPFPPLYRPDRERKRLDSTLEHLQKQVDDLFGLKPRGKK